jgi:hypothetical protein
VSAPINPWLPIAIVASLLFMWGSLHLRRKQRLLADLPTSKAYGVFIGLVELKGQAESVQPLRSFLQEMACVYYSYEVEEHWSHTVTETYTDKEGKTQTRTRTESGWKTVAGDGRMQDFYVQDETGAVLVRPKGAKIEPQVVFEQTVSQWDPLYYAKGPALPVLHSDHRRRFVERAIALHAPLYVVGQARERSDLVAPEIAEDPSAPLFLISTQPEETVQTGQAIGSWVCWLLGGACAAVAGMTFAAAESDSRTPLFIGIGAYLFLWVLCWIWMVFNSLTGLRHRVRQGWSLIDVQLKRRHDLIPNLVAIVSGLRNHEQTTQQAVAVLRTQLNATRPGVTGPDFEGLAGTIRAVVEKYPTLVAQDQFAQLHRALVETEQRIALARTYYNDIATHFATRLERIPECWVAQLSGMKPEPLLAAQNFERAPVSVQFAEAR